MTAAKRHLVRHRAIAIVPNPAATRVSMPLIVACTGRVCRVMRGKATVGHSRANGYTAR